MAESNGRNGFYHPELQQRVTCESCRAWLRKAGDSGECRNKPPEIMIDDDSNKLFARWPRTLSFDWCMEWSEKIEEFNH